MKYLLDIENADQVYETIIGATNRNVKLHRGLVKAVQDQLYLDRRGGPLGDLWSNDHFIASLDWQASE